MLCGISLFTRVEIIVTFLGLFNSITPVDTGRKLNVHKTFRRRPRRLLNVLCTFNLRPVSTGTWLQISSGTNKIVHIAILKGSSRDVRSIQTSQNAKWLKQDSNPQPHGLWTNNQPFSQTDQIIEQWCKLLSEVSLGTRLPRKTLFYTSHTLR